MKKNNFNIFKIIVLSIIAFASCSKDDLLVNEPSHRVIFTSEMDYENTVQVNGAISFGDVSAGVESRTWTFPEGVVDIEGSDDDVTSTEATVKAIFLEVGQFNVELNQVFKEDAFVEETLRGKTLDTTIVVTVVDSMQPAIQAFYLNDDGSLGAELVLEDNAENEIPASQSIQFFYTGEGSPETVTWTLEGGSPSWAASPELEIEAKYRFLGTFDVAVAGYRQRPFGFDTLRYENLIKVIPSTDPVVIEEVTDRNGKIALVFNREIDPATIDPSEFSVSIENGTLMATPAFASVETAPNEGFIVLIELDGESIYNDDIIKVSYIGNTLYSLDGVQADPFTDELLFFQKENILATQTDIDYSFENTTLINYPYLGWGDPYDKYTNSIETGLAQDGSQCMKVVMDPNGGMIIGTVDDNGASITFPVVTGQTYEIGVWAYAEDLGDPNVGLAPDLRFYWQPDIDFGIGPNPEFNSNFPLNEWVYSRAFVEFTTNDPKTFQIRGFNASNPQSLTFYFDNFSLAKVTLRP